MNPTFKFNTKLFRIFEIRNRLYFNQSLRINSDKYFNAIVFFFQFLKVITRMVCLVFPSHADHPFLWKANQQRATSTGPLVILVLLWFSGE